MSYRKAIIQTALGDKRSACGSMRQYLVWEPEAPHAKEAKDLLEPSSTPSVCVRDDERQAEVPPMNEPQ